METKDVKQLEQDIIDVLPDNYAFILIALPVGIPVAPTYISTMGEQSVEIMATIIADVSAVNRKNRDGT